MAQLKELMVAGDAQISGDLYAKNFSGTDGTTAGKAGLVPAPATSDNGKYLKSDGTWATVSGGGGGTSDYTDLTNKPSINSVTLSGNKTSHDLGIQTELATPLTADLYLVDEAPTSLTEGVYYTGNYKIYVNNVEVTGVRNSILRLNKYIDDDYEEDYFVTEIICNTNGDTIPHTVSISYFDDGLGDGARWTTAVNNFLAQSAIRTSMPSNPTSAIYDRYIPSLSLMATQLNTKQDTLSDATTTTSGLMSAADKTKLDNQFKELTSPVRIWDLDDGTYKLPASCQIYYYGADNTSNYFSISTTGYLFITHYSTTYKNWFIFCGNTSTTRYLYNGYTTSSGGANKAFNLGSSYLTGISSYVKNQLDYTTSNTTYALSAYQGYILNTNKADKTAFSGTDGSAAGTIGLVPAPAATDANKFLKSDGTWSTAVPITYSTTDLTAGSSPLDTGSFYFVYE